MLTTDIDLMAAGDPCGASAGFRPSSACGRVATNLSRRVLRASPGGMPHHDRPIGPATMR